MQENSETKKPQAKYKHLQRPKIIFITVTKKLLSKFSNFETIPHFRKLNNLNDNNNFILLLYLRNNYIML